MASNTFSMRCADRKIHTFSRRKQGRTPSADPKEIVPLRLHKSWRTRIAEMGMNEQAFIEDAVRDALFPVLQELLIQ